MDDAALKLGDFRGSDSADVILELFELLAQEKSGVGTLRESRSRRCRKSASGTKCGLCKVCSQAIGVAEICL